MMGFFKKKKVVKVEPYTPKNNLTIQEIEHMLFHGEIVRYDSDKHRFVDTDIAWDSVQSMIKMLGSDKKITSRNGLKRLQWYIILLIIKKLNMNNKEQSCQ